MSTSTLPATPIADPIRAGSAEDASEGLLGRLDEAFGQRLVVMDNTSGVLERVSSDWPRIDVFRWVGLCEQVARRGRPEPIEDCPPLMLLAVPLEPTGGDRVAVAVLKTDRVESVDDIHAAARLFGLDAHDALAWARPRETWSPRIAICLAESIVEGERTRLAASSQKSQLSDVTTHLLATFDELDLLHRLTEQLSLDQATYSIAAETVRWMTDVVPAEAVVARWLTTERSEEASSIVAGRSPLDESELDAFFESLGPSAAQRSLVLNRDRTSSPTWRYPGVREVVTAPIREGDHLVGWIAAINRRQPSRALRAGAKSAVFGTVEASLLSSVAAILGVHSGNRRLFDEQRELFDGAMRAFSSALDAKDPYTRGHSDRVAKIAVRLAQQLGVGPEQIETLGLAGLLHDIGKIGIDDGVLRKPDKLTDAEYEHIKQHPELGETILRGVPQLGSVLPVVRHHHEAWDGGGYPDGLVGEATPLLARITAVADAIDAMGSDRPYRSGMPVERIETILRDGAGRQWDATVVDAYFGAREDVVDILHTQGSPTDFEPAIAAV